MNITVINGTEKHGVTYRLKEMFLADFSDNANITEYYLPKDCPAFCAGCTNCILKGEQKCKDAEYIRKIEKSLLEADLIVMTSPAYVFHATGAMKALLDHFAYRWIPHRPAPEMFGKTSCHHNTMLGQRSKICGKRYEAQLIVVGHFQNRDIYRCIDKRYRLGKIAAKETSRACGKASKAVSEVCSYRLYKARTYKFDYEI